MRLGPYDLGYNETPECGIYQGDARELARAIPDESVDLIFTDPVYDRIDDYRWLAETAARVLKPEGTLLVWSNGRWHYQNTRWLDTGILFYQWTFASIASTSSAPMNGKIISKTNRVIWFNKNNGRHMRTFLPDGYLSIGGSWLIAKGVHKWGKSGKFTRLGIECFSDSNAAIIFDPFTGGGTVPAVCKQLGRQYLAFEIDPDTVTLARDRVWQTQPPLFVLEPEQQEMEL